MGRPVREYIPPCRSWLKRPKVRQEVLWAFLAVTNGQAWHISVVEAEALEFGEDRDPAGIPSSSGINSLSR
jgi:hypothetical protein